MLNRSRLIDEFIELVKVDSISLHEREMADRLTSKLQRMGYDVEEEDFAEEIGGNAGNLRCYIQGNDSVPAIMFMAHMDTIVPGIGKNPIIENNLVKTNGKTVLGADDLAGVACILEALEVLKEQNVEHGDIHIVFTVAEEIGLQGVKHLDFGSFKNTKPQYCFVMDSTGPVGTVVVKAPYHSKIQAVVLGKSAHAGAEPEKGTSAIKIAADAIAKMNLGRIDCETTANIGIIKGGSVVNVVCDRVEIQAEVRSINKSKMEREIEYMRKCLEEKSYANGGNYEFEVDEQYQGFNIDPNDCIISILRPACAMTGVELQLVAIGGGSDTNIVNEKGISAVNIGIGACDIHSTREYIDIESMVKATELIVNIVKCVQRDMLDNRQLTGAQVK